MREREHMTHESVGDTWVDMIDIIGMIDMIDMRNAWRDMHFWKEHCP